MHYDMMRYSETAVSEFSLSDVNSADIIIVDPVERLGQGRSWRGLVAAPLGYDEMLRLLLSTAAADITVTCKDTKIHYSNIGLRDHVGADYVTSRLSDSD